MKSGLNRSLPLAPAHANKPGIYTRHYGIFDWGKCPPVILSTDDQELVPKSCTT